MCLGSLYVDWILNSSQQRNRSLQVQLAEDCKLFLLETPDLQLILLAHRHDAFLALKLVNLLDLLFMNAETCKDQIDTVYMHEYD